MSHVAAIRDDQKVPVRKLGPPKVGTSGKPATFRGDRLSLLRLEELRTVCRCLLGHLKHTAHRHIHDYSNRCRQNMKTKTEQLPNYSPTLNYACLLL